MSVSVGAVENRRCHSAHKSIRTCAYLALEALHVDPPPHGQEQLPQVVHAHGSAALAPAPPLWCVCRWCGCVSILLVMKRRKCRRQHGAVAGRVDPIGPQWNDDAVDRGDTACGARQKGPSRSIECPLECWRDGGIVESLKKRRPIMDAGGRG